MWKRYIILLMFLALLAACSTTDKTDETNPTPTPNADIIAEGPQNRVEITLESPPEWREASDVLTVNNIARATYLGRIDNASTTEMSTVFNHTFSPDGALLAVLDNNNLTLWDLITGRGLFAVSRRNATNVFFSSDKSELYTVDPNGGVIIYNAENGTPINDLRAHTAYSGVVRFYGDGDLLAIGGTDSTVKVWDMVERTSIVTLQTSAGIVTALDFSPDGTQLAVGGTNATIENWEWRGRNLLNTFPANADGIDRIAFSPDGTRMAVALQYAVLMFDLATYEPTYALELGEGATRDVMAFSPDGRYLITAGTTEDMLIWDVTDGARLANLPGIGGETVRAAFSPDGGLLLTVVRGGAVSLWNMDSLSPSGIASAPIEVPSDRIFNVDWSPDGFLMLFFDQVGPLYVWGVPPQN